MLKNIATIVLWTMAPVLIFISANLYAPYLAMLRGWGDVALAVGELALLGALFGFGILAPARSRRKTAAPAVVLAAASDGICGNRLLCP